MERFTGLSKRFAERKVERRAAPATPTVPSPGDTHGPTMLFVQSFESGTIAPKVGSDDRYTVTLNHGLGQTMLFSDRPDRLVGSNPTDRFFRGLGFSDENPPNAALVFETADASSEITVVELFNPTYDAAGPTVTYDIAVLKNWQNDDGPGFSAAATDLASLSATFGAAHVFIDDCADGPIDCVAAHAPSDGSARYKGRIPIEVYDGFCYSWKLESCVPCSPWTDDPALIRSYWTSVCVSAFDCSDCIPEGLCDDWESESCLS